ncbi:O-antigen ligase family protein [uncultured Bacteroides sp.]|uniref:O-antigen ligase family protein n=1 Tax=uncultured Bacteroides sp. TaxID=162156 RepID=UPI0025CB9955|nr:O-antigen ligase family protein [uncultured Bacteroides sp.]
MTKFLKLLYKAGLDVLKSRYRWLGIFFLVWLYRVDFIPADGGGFAKILQVATLFGMFYIVYKRSSNIVSYSFNKTNNSVKSCLCLYFFGLLSTLWALIPTFAFFLSLQNIVILLVLIWLFSQLKSFVEIERCFLLLTMYIMLFEAIFFRAEYGISLFIHCLPCGTTAALCISYTVGELLGMRTDNVARKSVLRACLIVSLIVIITSTSSGANASAVAGVIVASMLSGKILIAFILLLLAIILYFNQDLVNSLIFFLMPGKDMEGIKTATGRSYLWDIMMELAAQKPLFGWGFGCIERAATLTGRIESPDAHNNYLGLYGSIGIVGSAIAYIHFIIQTLFCFKRTNKVGYLGLLSATCCALLNGYSYGFLSGKACSITVVYLALVALTFSYSKVRMYDFKGIK